MLITTTECKSILNISTSVTTYDTLIGTYIPYVLDDICEIANHRYHDAYHWVWNDYMVFSSSSKTITLGYNSTYSFLSEFEVGDTIDIINSYKNNGFKTISSITSSHVLVTSESLINENSTDYAIKTYLYRCFFSNSIKVIASKMIWFNTQNTTTVQGNIQSESLGNYSVSYGNSQNKIGASYGIYPASLISGIKKAVSVW